MKHLSWVLVTIFLLAGCGSTDNKSTSEQEGKGQAPQNERQNSENETKDQSALQLNDGKRWKTDQSTRQGMEKINRLVQDYNNRETLGTKDYKQLGQAIQNHMQTIHKECSMQGQAHKELHKFISRIHPHIQNLQASEEAKAKAAFKSIKELMGKYKEYFK